MATLRTDTSPRDRPPLRTAGTRHARCDALTRLLHEAAQYAADRYQQLARRIRTLGTDLLAAAVEMAEGRCAEPLLTGRHDELLALASRHRDPLTHLDSLARAVSERAATRNEPSETP